MIFFEFVFFCVGNQVFTEPRMKGTETASTPLQWRGASDMGPDAARAHLLESAVVEHTVDQVLPRNFDYDGVFIEDCLNAGLWVLHPEDDDWFDGTEGTPYA